MSWFWGKRRLHTFAVNGKGRNRVYVYQTQQMSLLPCRRGNEVFLGLRQEFHNWVALRIKKVKENFRSVVQESMSTRDKEVFTSQKDRAIFVVRTLMLKENLDCFFFAAFGITFSQLLCTRWRWVSLVQKNRLQVVVVREEWDAIILRFLRIVMMGHLDLFLWSVSMRGTSVIVLWRKDASAMMLYVDSHVDPQCWNYKCYLRVFYYRVLEHYGSIYSHNIANICWLRKGSPSHFHCFVLHKITSIVLITIKA